MRPGRPWRRDEQPMPHPATGLYNPAYEHDSCGVAMVVDMHGRRSRDIVDKAITALLNLEHRGAAGAEPNSGDGAGIMLQIPDKFFRAVLAEQEASSYPPRAATRPVSPSCRRGPRTPPQRARPSRRSSRQRV